MLKIYDSNHEFLKIIDSQYKDLYITETLSTGQKALCFKVPCLKEYLQCIQEENYIETADYSYVIKEVVLENNDFLAVYCVANIEDLTGRIFTIFDCFQKPIKQAYEYCLAPVDNWTIDYKSVDQSVLTYQLPDTTAYEMLTTIAEDYGQELWFDTKRKVIQVYDKMGKNIGAYYSNELKLKQLKKQSSTYDYATILYPYGKNGLKISDVNNGMPFLENYNYTHKRIEKVWINEDYDVPELLKKAAEEHLNEISQPRASYKLTLSDLGKDVSIGDQIMIVDKIKRIRQMQRAVKIIRYPLTPEKDSIEISNIQIDFADSFIRGQKKVKEEIIYLKKLYKDLFDKVDKLEKK